jgi:hypothetical protein
VPGGDDGAEIVDEPGDLELEVGGLDRREQGCALEPVGEEVDRLAVERTAADGEPREELVDGLGGFGLGPIVRATDGWAVLRVSQGSRDDHLMVARTRHAVHRWVRCCWHHGSEIERRS